MSELTVVVGIKNKCLKHVRRFIESLDCQTIPIQLIVVDYGSDERHLGQIRRLAHLCYDPLHLPIRLIEVTRNTEHWNESRALNIGIKQVTTPYLFTTNADLILDPDFCQVVLSTLKQDPKTFVLCKRRLDLNANGQVLGLSDSCFYGTCMGALTEWFHMAHGFDERYEGWGRMDIDIAYRAGEDGLVWNDIQSQTEARHQYHKHIPRTGDMSWWWEAFERNNEIFKIWGPIVRNPNGWGEL